MTSFMIDIILLFPKKNSALWLNSFPIGYHYYEIVLFKCSINVKVPSFETNLNI